MPRLPKKIPLILGLSLASAVVILLCYFYFHWNNADPIWSNIVAEVVVLLVVAVVAFILGRIGLSLNSMQSESTGAVISFYPEHSETDWASIIRSAKRIDIVVHYYGRWVRRYDAEFVSFFERGGDLRIVMSDPDIPRVLTDVHVNFFTNLTRKELSNKIKDTEINLADLFQQAASRKARLLTYYLPQALHYSFVMVNNRFLYLSVYEQFRGANVRSSVFGIDLSKDRALEEYWLQNRDTFINSSRLGIEL